MPWSGILPLSLYTCMYTCIIYWIGQNTWEHSFLEGGVCDTLEKFRFSGFSDAFGVFYELGQYDLLYTLWDHTMIMKHPIESVCRIQLQTSRKSESTLSRSR